MARLRRETAQARAPPERWRLLERHTKTVRRVVKELTGVTVTLGWISPISRFLFSLARTWPSETIGEKGLADSVRFGGGKYTWNLPDYLHACHTGKDPFPPLLRPLPELRWKLALFRVQKAVFMPHDFFKTRGRDGRTKKKSREKKCRRAR